jgi:hypothetical protein
MVNKYMKKCSIFLAIKEIQWKLHRDSISLQLDWPLSIKQTITNTGKDAGQKNPLYTVGGNAN